MVHQFTLKIHCCSVEEIPQKLLFNFIDIVQICCGLLLGSFPKTLFKVVIFLLWLSHSANVQWWFFIFCFVLIEFKLHNDVLPSILHLLQKLMLLFFFSITSKDSCWLLSKQRGRWKERIMKTLFFFKLVYFFYSLNMITVCF